MIENPSLEEKEVRFIVEAVEIFHRGKHKGKRRKEKKVKKVTNRAYAEMTRVDSFF